jgi:hypothetical protein
MAVGQVSFHSDKTVGRLCVYFLSSAAHFLSARSKEVILNEIPVHDHHFIITTVHVEKRENAIVNRLNKTKVERAVDHEQEKVDRLKQEHAAKRAAAAAKVCFEQPMPAFSLISIPIYLQKQSDKELALAREAEKAARSYDALFNVEVDPDEPQKTVRELEEDFM